MTEAMWSASAAIRLLTWQSGRTTLWPLLAQPEATAAVVHALVAPFAGVVDVVAGPDPGGILFGAPAAAELGVPFAPICRDTDFFFQNTDPAVTVEQDGLTLYAHQPLLRPGARVLLVDDWSESGRTVSAALDLIAGCGARLVAVSMLVDSLPQRIRRRLNAADVQVHALAKPHDLNAAA